MRVLRYKHISIIFFNLCTLLLVNLVFVRQYIILGTFVKYFISSFEMAELIGCCKYGSITP